MQKEKSIPISESGQIIFSGKKLTEDQQLMLLKLLQNDPTCTTSELLERAEQSGIDIRITPRHINRIRSRWGYSRPKGRPAGKKDIDNSNKELFEIKTDLSSVGVHLFAEWMENKKRFSDVLVILKQAIEAWRADNPDASFPLLNHSDETLMLRFKALFYAPLLGIGKLTEFDYKEHTLKTVIGRTYQSSTLTQYLGELERINAGKMLVNILRPSESGRFCYIDGHMIAFWSTVSMHKGKITMLGRIMGGSQAVVAHDENSQALYVEYHAPDMRMPNMIFEYCRHIADAVGIDMFVIDREVNSESIGIAFEENGWGLLCMLDNNQYKDLSDWDYEFEGKLENGNEVYAGSWKDQDKRKKDPRHFVIVKKNDRLLPYWGTSKIKETVPPPDWPKTYSERTEIQENAFKRMKCHAALGVNYGIKKIWGPDRHQARARKKSEESAESIRGRAIKKEEKVIQQKVKVKESEENGHGKRLEQRQKNLTVLEKELKEIKKKEEKVENDMKKLGPAKERADRDFRKQLIMTIRTLFLENSLLAFFAIWLGNSGIKIGIDHLITMLFDRKGAYMETSVEIFYIIDDKGLSAGYREILKKLADGFNEMKLERQSKPIHVKIRGDT